MTAGPTNRDDRWLALAAVFIITGTAVWVLLPGAPPLPSPPENPRPPVAPADVPDGSLDFVYIDANHEQTFVTQDLRAWHPKVRAGGIMSGHDYIVKPGRPYIQVKPAVNAYAAAHGIAPWVVIAAERTPSWMWVAA